MVFKKSIYLLLLLAICNSFTQVVFAQNATKQFRQFIEWEKVDYAIHYEIVLEKKNELNEWNIHDSFDVTTNSLELTLGAGDYRYNITVYNVFGRAEQTSDWYTVTIEQALQPIVTDIFPKKLDLKADGKDDETAIIALNPQDVSEQATFSLQSIDKSTTLYGNFIGYNESDMMQIEFETEQLGTGDYEFIIQDPSGLTSENVSPPSLVNVERTKPSYVNLSLGYTYALFPPIENGLFSDYDFPSRNISGRAKVSYFPLVSATIGALGFELSSFVIYNTFATNSTELSGFIFPTTLNLAYHKPIGENFVFTTHLGAGISVLNKFMESSTATDLNTIAGIAANAGTTGQYFITDNFFAELGVDYVLTYFIDGASIHTILPTLAVGWKLSGKTAQPETQKSMDAPLSTEIGIAPYVTISAGYTYALFPPFQNTLFNDYDFPSKNISGRAKVSYFPLASSNSGSFGVEISSFLLYNTFTKANKELKGLILPATVNGAYQKQFGNKFVFDAHLGIGVTLLANFKENTTATEVDDIAGIATNVGIAGQYFITDNFFAELGVDYVLTYFTDAASIHSILPTLSVGWKFE